MTAGADGGRGADFYPYPLGASPRAYDSTTREGRVGYVDQLFAFSEPLGYDYSGDWLDASAFGTADSPSSVASPPSEKLGIAKEEARATIMKRAVITVETKR